MCAPLTSGRLGAPSGGGQGPLVSAGSGALGKEKGRQLAFNFH